MHIARRAAILIATGALLLPSAFFAQALQPDTPTSAPIVPADQQPDKEQLVKLYEVLRMRKQLESRTQMMAQIVQQQFHAQLQEVTAASPGNRLTSENQKQIEGILARYIQKAMTLYTADQMFEDITPIYQRYLTKDDVASYVAFFGSSAGQHFLDAQPLIMKEYMPLVVQRQQALSQQLTADMQKELADYIRSIAGQKNTAPSDSVPQVVPKP